MVGRALAHLSYRDRLERSNMKHYRYYVHVVNQPTFSVLDAVLGPFPTRGVARKVRRKNRDSMTEAWIEKRETKATK